MSATEPACDYCVQMPSLFENLILAFKLQVQTISYDF